MKLKTILLILTLLPTCSLALAAYAINERVGSNTNLNPFSKITNSKSDKWIQQSISELRQRTALSYRVQSYQDELQDETLVMVNQLGVSDIDWDDANFRYSAASSILNVHLRGKAVEIAGEPVAKLTVEFRGDDTFDFHHTGLFELEIGPCVAEKSKCRGERQNVMQHLEEQFQEALSEIETKTTVEARRLVNAS